MNNYSYWPYDEVSLEREMPTGLLKLKTPWLEATTKSEFFHPEQLAMLCEKMDAGSLSPHDLPSVNSFFRCFHQYPVAYILPTPKHTSPLDTHQLIDTTLFEGDLEVMARDIFTQNKEAFTEEEFEHLFQILQRTECLWDHEAALGFATIDNKIHPESVFSVARRFHLLELMSSDSGNETMHDLGKLNVEEYKDAVCRLLRQNHYITEKCNEALVPALTIAQSSAPLVEAFMKEERGHDKILAKALFHVGKQAEKVEVCLQTRALMMLLKFMAGRNFLAFSMAIDAFERNNYQNVDPLAQLLINGGYEKAAEFANLHMKINDEGGHENVAGQFLASMDLCSKEYALEALRLMELLSLTMSKVSSSAWGVGAARFDS